MTLKTCLRCDWQGETEEPKCPNCGERSLYVVGAPPSAGAGVPVQSHPRERSREAASTASVGPVRHPAPSVEPSPSPTDAVEPSGRSARSTIAFVLAAFLLTVTLGTWLNADAERSAPAASTDAASPSDGSPGPVVQGSYLLDLRTGVETSLSEDLADGRDFAASRDGTRLAYVGNDYRGSPQIFVAGIDGTGVRQMTGDLAGATWPAWSPDATMLAYLGKRGDLFVLDVTTGESTLITDETSRWSGQPQFTPNGSSLIFTGGISSKPELRIVPVAGGKSSPLIGLSDGLTDSGSGSLSPDGSLLTFKAGGSFESDHCGPCRFVANADGTEMRVIPGCGSSPAGTWSPDGSQIVCSDRNRIIVIDIATGQASRVAEGRGAIWLERHTLLVEGSVRPTPASGGPAEHPPSRRLSRIVEGVAFSFSVPTAAWHPGPVKQAPDGNGFRNGNLFISQSIMGPQGAEAVVFWTSFPDGGRADPCANLLSPPVGPSTADLATLVATAPGTDLVTGPSDVTVGGYPAKRVVLSIRKDLGCDPGFFYTWRSECFGPCWMETNVGDTIRVWIVDVDGTRLFIAAETTTQADADLKREIQEIVGSIRFD